MASQGGCAARRGTGRGRGRWAVGWGLSPPEGLARVLDVPAPVSIPVPSARTSQSPFLRQDSHRPQTFHLTRVSAWAPCHPCQAVARVPHPPGPGLTRHVSGGDDAIALDLPVVLAKHALGYQRVHPHLRLQLGASASSGVGGARLGAEGESEALTVVPKGRVMPAMAADWTHRIQTGLGAGHKPRRGCQTSVALGQGRGRGWGRWGRKTEGRGLRPRGRLPSAAVAHTTVTSRLHRPFLPRTERLRR